MPAGPGVAVVESGIGAPHPNGKAERLLASVGTVRSPRSPTR